MVEAAESVDCAQDTAVAWFQYCRDVAKKIAWHEFNRIGGPHDVVEIDETHLFKRKFNVGRQVMWNHVWIFGGISRTTKQRFGVLVNDRSANTLLPILQDHVDEDSYICSDHWRAYNQVKKNFAIRVFEIYGR